MSAFNREDDSEDEFESADEGEPTCSAMTKPPTPPPACDKIVTDVSDNQVQPKLNTEAATVGWDDWNIDDEAPIETLIKVSNPSDRDSLSSRSTSISKVGDSISQVESEEEVQPESFSQQYLRQEEYQQNLVRIRPEKARKDIEMSQSTEMCSDEILPSSSMTSKHDVKDAHRVLDQLAEQSPKYSSTWTSSWNNFGSLLSTAKQSVSTLKSTVSEGFNAVIESVEAGLGAPDPQKLAEMNRMAFEIKGETSDSDDEPEVPVVVTDSQDLVINQDGWLNALSIEKLTNTGIKVVSGGLDVLETVGKKTFDVITEADHEYNGKRRLFKRRNQRTLSEIIREAKTDKNMISTETSTEITTFLHQFEKHQGLAHFEALELLSNQASIVLQTMSCGHEDTLKQIDRYFQINDNDDDDNDFDTDYQFESLSTDDDHNITQIPTLDTLSQRFTAYQSQLHSTVPVDKLLEVYESANQFIKEWDWMDTELDQKTLADEAIDTLAILCARIIEYYRRTAELFVMGCKSLTSFAIDIELLTIYEKQQKDFSFMLAGIPNLFATCMKQISNISANGADLPIRCDPQLKQKLLNQMFIQSSSSRTYASDAYMLLQPIVSQSILYHTSTTA